MASFAPELNVTPSRNTDYSDSAETIQIQLIEVPSSCDCLHHCFGQPKTCKSLLISRHWYKHGKRRPGLLRPMLDHFQAASNPINNGAPLSGIDRQRDIGDDPI